MRNISKYIIIFFIIMLALPVFGQKKNSVTISGIIAKFTGMKDESYHGQKLDYDLYPGLGAELIYMRNIENELEIGTGLNYQLGLAASFFSPGGETGFIFNDISLPILLRKYIKLRTHNKFYATTGFYFGKTTKVKALWRASSGWKQFPANKVENYSDDVTFSDFYLDFGYHTSLKKKFVFSVAPFLKYRINNTWMNYHQNKFYYGFKLNFSLNF